MMARPQSRAQRKTAFIKAHIRVGEDWVEITIGNISTSGLMVKCQNSPPVGAHVAVRRRGTGIMGEVVWSTRTRFGLRSFEPIDVEALTAESGLNANQVRGEEPGRRRLWHWRRQA